MPHFLTISLHRNDPNCPETVNIKQIRKIGLETPKLQNKKQQIGYVVCMPLRVGGRTSLVTHTDSRKDQPCQPHAFATRRACGRHNICLQCTCYIEVNLLETPKGSLEGGTPSKRPAGFLEPGVV